MNVSLSNMLATGIWVAFLSVLAIIGIIVAGGLIVAVLGKAVLSVLGGTKANGNAGKVDEFGYTYTNTNDVQSTYVMQNEENLQQPQTVNVKETAPQDDYSYALDVDDEVAKVEQEALNKELNHTDEDDFFKDFVGEDDVRFGDDDDLMGMIDEISQDVLDEEEQAQMQTEQAESQANQSMLDKYSIDSYFDDEVSEDESIIEDNISEDDFSDEPIFEEDESVVAENSEIEKVVDEETISEINALKQQVREIVESMEENRNQSETFNEQLINILNELKEANNKKEVKTEQDAEREINELKQQLEDSRAEMEQQLQERIASKDAEMQERLQEQLEASNAEIESLKAQLSLLLKKMEEPEDDVQEVEPVVEDAAEEKLDDIAALRAEVKEMLDDMREQNDAKSTVFNAQLLEILNEMKEATLKQSEQVKIETAEEAVDEVDEWQEQLKLAETELRKQFQEEMLHKDEEQKAELRAQMESYNEEISELKTQLSFLMDKFKEESESAKAENQALIDQLEAERKQRINLEQEKLDAEKEQLEQIEKLRKENEELADKLHSRTKTEYAPLTEEEMDDLYSETEDIDYAAISQMNEEQIDKKVKAGLESSKQEIDELREQVSRLASYIEERENTLAEQINVHEVRTADFDIEEIKEFTAKEVEARVKEKLIDSLAEIQILKEDLVNTKKEIERQYKEQLANKNTGMEYDRVSKLQTSAEKIDDLNAQLKELTESIRDEQHNVKKTSKQCVAELETLRETKAEEVKVGDLEDNQMAVIGPKNNKVALIVRTDSVAEAIKDIDEETVKQLSEAELDEIIDARLQDSNNVIESLKQEIEQLKKDLVEKNEQIEKNQVTSVPVVRSPLFDVEMIKNITAKEVEQKVQERLAEAMKEIDEMKKQLELSKQEIERQYKEEVANNRAVQTELKDKLKISAAEVIELKEQLIDLTEQITLDHQEAKQNSRAIAEQLELDRKEKEEIAKLQLTNGQDDSSMAVATTEVTVIGPTNNQVALVTGSSVITEDIDEMGNIPTIDIETVRKLAEEEIEEKVQQRMSSSIIEIEELKKQILNLSIQIQEMKNKPDEDEGEKPLVFHYATEEAYLERLAILEERLKNAKKDLKLNAKELNPLEKVNRTLERDKVKLRRKNAIAAKKKVDLYGVNNYVDLDKEKAEKLKQELELLEGLKLSVKHCEEVMNANIDRYPILVHTNKILKENIANIESDIDTLNKELKALREKNGTSNN